MYEIELKAHVEDRQALIKKLESFAYFSGAVEKDDTYYGKTVEGRQIQVRIRKETPFTPKELDLPEVSIDSQKTVIFTYKKKELLDKDGKAIEVNDEQECTLDEAAPLESFLKDVGFKTDIVKHKVVLDWQYNDVLFELCKVPPLGDFIEIEIMSNSNDPKQVENTNKKLLAMLAKCGISEDKIEKRYYTQMLQELGGK